MRKRKAFGQARQDLLLLFVDGIRFEDVKEKDREMHEEDAFVTLLQIVIREYIRDMLSVLHLRRVVSQRLNLLRVYFIDRLRIVITVDVTKDWEMKDGIAGRQLRRSLAKDTAC